MTNILNTEAVMMLPGLRYALFEVNEVSTSDGNSILEPRCFGLVNHWEATALDVIFQKDNVKFMGDIFTWSKQMGISGQMHGNEYPMAKYNHNLKPGKIIF